MGGVFLNAYLPEIAPRNKIGRISGYGWSLGYIGGLIALAICYIMLIVPDAPINPFSGELLDKSSYEHIRIINIFIAIWFAIFSIPTFLYVNSNNQNNKTSKKLILNSFKSISQTFIEIKKYKRATIGI